MHAYDETEPIGGRTSSIDCQSWHDGSADRATEALATSDTVVPSEASWVDSSCLLVQQSNSALTVNAFEAILDILGALDRPFRRLAAPACSLSFLLQDGKNRESGEKLFQFIWFLGSRRD